MRIFLTGATGFIGEAIVRELLAAGHQVLGLARSDASADSLTGLGCEVRRGDLSDTEGLAAGARACDGVIHTAFIHDFSKYQAAAETDRRAVEAIAGALEGSDKPFVATSVTVLLAPGRLGTETDPRAPDNPVGIRAASEETVLSAAGRGVRASVVRLPPSVHGAGDHSFVPALIDIPRRKGFSALIGDGANRWPAVHRLDAARLFRLALENAVPGSAWSAVAEEGIARMAMPPRPEHRRERSIGAFRLAGALCCSGQSDLQHSHPQCVGMEPQGKETPDGYERERIFLIRSRPSVLAQGFHPPFTYLQSGP